MLNRTALKELLGEIPLTAELYWQLRQAGQPVNAQFSLKRLARHLPEWAGQAGNAHRRAAGGRQVAVFATLHYWIEHACLLSLALAGLGHRVSFSYLPFANWKNPLNRFDLRRQNAYAASVLRQAEPPLSVVPLLDVRAQRGPLPADLEAQVQAVARRDTQYSLQQESVDTGGELYQLRLERLTAATRAALTWLKERRPEVVIVPNGSILEFGAVYAAARHLGLDTVSYEFGEQDQRIWLAQNGEVMRQETDSLWAAWGERALTEVQTRQVRELFAARQRGGLWQHFARRWQGVPSEGGRRVRDQLGLDGRPITLLATNVIGDSLTLDRQTFSASMAEWIARTARYFAGRPDLQFVVRIHPGELITGGPSVAEVVRQAVPELPEHVHLIPADAQVNTYDLMEVADLGLVYTTTVGLELAMGGAPVIVVGQTHYRGKGFTLDPDSWEGYFDLLDRALADPARFRPTPEQIERAWGYAYAFFFAYPRPFPWHLLHYWDRLDRWPLERVLDPAGREAFGRTFDQLAGEPLDWAEILADLELDSLSRAHTESR